MIYIIADIHGCYEQYKKLLAKIQFSDEDELYVLGDAMDRGPEPIKVILDIMSHSNIHYILGNHDFMMYKIMSKFIEEITDENISRILTVDNMMDYQMWMADGGAITAKQFQELPERVKRRILDYMEEADLYAEIKHGEKRYILVHGGLGKFSEEKDLWDYTLDELLWERPDFSKRLFDDENVHVVVGHTPTRHIEGWEKPEVYMQNGYIALDCGCVGEGRLAAYCIETDKIVYSD